MTPARSGSEPALLLEDWQVYFAGLVDRLRTHAIEVADALDAAIALRAILAATDLPESRTLEWSDLLAAQPSELDRADLQSKFNRALNPDALPNTNTQGGFIQ